MYVCQLSLLQLLIWVGYRHFKERLPEAICCCLQTCNVDVGFNLTTFLANGVYKRSIYNCCLHSKNAYDYQQSRGLKVGII